MGNTWKVIVVNGQIGTLNLSTTYVAYSGESLIKALFTFWRQKGRNAGYVKLEWR